MKLKTKSEIYRKLRLLFNIMMGVGYLLLSYLIILIAFSGERLDNSVLAIAVIVLCCMGQISQYRNAYKDIRKDCPYYIGTLPPTITLLCLFFAAAKIYIF